MTVAERQETTGEVDTRDPRLRLAWFFDEGTLQLLGDEDDSGFLVGEGDVAGAPAIAFASDARVQGGAMGSTGCSRVVEAYEDGRAHV